jgi:hypothetical protein
MTPTPNNSGTRDIVLGERTFAVPVLPHRYNRVIYPLCRDLSGEPEDEDTFVDRMIKGMGSPGIVRDEEWDKLAEIAFQAACAADKTVTREAFDDLTIKPQDLIDAFFAVRYQTGVWIAPDAGPDAGAEAGTGPGEAKTGEAGAG